MTKYDLAQYTRHIPPLSQKSNFTIFLSCFRALSISDEVKPVDSPRLSVHSFHPQFPSHAVTVSKTSNKILVGSIKSVYNEKICIIIITNIRPPMLPTHVSTILILIKLLLIIIII